MAVQNLTRVYFDGLCHLCSREIEHYRKQRGSESLVFIDITAPEFECAKEGLDPVQVHRELHVRRADQSIAVGVDAFVTIWQILPNYRLLARMATLPIINPLLRIGYQAFAKIRPMLPKRKLDCTSSPYCEMNHHSNANREKAEP